MEIPGKASWHRRWRPNRVSCRETCLVQEDSARPHNYDNSLGEPRKPVNAARSAGYDLRLEADIRKRYSRAALEELMAFSVCALWFDNDMNIPRQSLRGGGRKSAAC